MEKTFKIYKHKNLKNGKIYIGQTAQETEDRWEDGKRNYNKHLVRAIKKYGWQGFSHEILYENLSSEEADYYETLLIEQLQSMDPEKGYNKTSGGKKFSHLSEDTKKKISKSIKSSQLFLENNRRSHFKKVVGMNIETGEVLKFDSLKEAGAALNIVPSAIGNACLGKIKTARDFVWQFNDENFKEFNFDEVKNIRKLSEERKKWISDHHKKKKILPIKAINSVKKPVIGTNLITGEKIEFDCGASAEKALNINHVNSVCKGNRAQAGGYKWDYKKV